MQSYTDKHLLVSLQGSNSLTKLKFYYKHYFKLIFGFLIGTIFRQENINFELKAKLMKATCLFMSQCKKPLTAEVEQSTLFSTF